jgi:hypothetical protein
MWSVDLLEMHLHDADNKVYAQYSLRKQFAIYPSSRRDAVETQPRAAVCTHFVKPVLCEA